MVSYLQKRIYRYREGVGGDWIAVSAEPPPGTVVGANEPVVVRVLQLVPYSMELHGIGMGFSTMCV
jgi:hypothetical protein